MWQILIYFWVWLWFDGGVVHRVFMVLGYRPESGDRRLKKNAKT